MMTANLNIIYYVLLDVTGKPIEEYPRCAHYDQGSDVWIDAQAGITIEYLGLVLGKNSVYSSPNQYDVEQWIKNPNNC